MKNKGILILILVIVSSCQVRYHQKLYPNRARFSPKSNIVNYLPYVSSSSSNYTSKFSVYFDYNVFSLSSSSQSQLDDFVSQLNENDKNQAYYVEGNTDDSGTDNYNMILSRYRAENVKEYLVSKGLKSENLFILPKGETNPIANNTTEANLNRRVTIYIKN